MILRGRTASEIEREDLQRLLDAQLQERDTLEYKSAMYGNTDDDKREMLKDISSMANHRGGYLVIGMEEDAEGIPTCIVGIEQGNHVERISDSCLDNIDRRILGLGVDDIQLTNGRLAVIVSIPQSMNAPHMVTFKGLNQFWKRHGRQKDKMSVDEIADAFEKRASTLTRLERFLLARRLDILEEIGGHTYMVLSAMPAHWHGEAVIDIHDQQLHATMSSPPELPGRPESLACGQPYYTFNGLRADDWHPYRSQSKGRTDYLEVFRNGYIEYGNLIATPDEQDIGFHVVANAVYIINFVNLIEEVYGTCFPLVPVVFNVAIYNATGMYLQGGNLRNADQVKWSKQHLELEKIYVNSMGEESKLLSKAINDRIWNAFHRERATIFDDKGDFFR